MGPKLTNRMLVGRLGGGGGKRVILKVETGVRNGGLAGEFLLTQMMNPSSASFDLTSPCRRIGSSSDAKI